MAELLELYYGDGGESWSGRVRLVSGIQDSAAVGERMPAGVSADILHIFLKDYSVAEGPTERSSSELCLFGRRS